ncbi:hypothetical protein BSZ35_12075 [Salinibacter sp. 10B]|uniref:hypothetical protein n=1 Tax=Salinibacter sp. 10B TaxID=1923971 RepID=UPI000CF4D779|nr:hypothetical protein [Salinibacter sp. 10B]PQJ35233.1 hypothetical protein BSZ35_12075 [Salinibacter sp. 10B]
MYKELWSRFDNESELWAHDPALHSSYNDRKRIEAGQSAEVAKQKITTISRSLRGLKLERQKLLCELVIAHCDEGAAGEHTSEDREAVVA